MRNRRADQRVALVTGASGGIGSAICSQLIDDGYKVIGQSRSIEHCKVPSGVDVFKGEFSSASGCHEFVETLGGEIRSIDILVNCAGSAHIRKEFSELASQEFLTGFSINFLSAFVLSQAILPFMVEKQEGVIINIGSNTTSHKGSLLNFDYFLGKSAIDSMTLFLNKHFASHNIRINCIKPGLIDSGMHRTVPGYSDQDLLERVKAIPVRRMGLPTEIARLVSVLAGESGDYVSGQIFAVAGGE